MLTVSELKSDSISEYLDKLIEQGANEQTISAFLDTVENLTIIALGGE